MSWLKKLFGAKTVKLNQARTSYIRPKLEVLEDRITPSNFFWDPRGADNNASNLNNWDLTTFGSLMHPGQMPTTNDNVYFDGRSNNDCTVDRSFTAGSITIQMGYFAKINIQDGQFVNLAGTYLDDGNANNNFNVGTNNTGELLISGGAGIFNTFRNVLISGSGTVDFSEPATSYLGGFSGLNKCEIDCNIVDDGGNVVVGPTSLNSGHTPLSTTLEVVVKSNGAQHGTWSFQEDPTDSTNPLMTSIGYKMDIQAGATCKLLTNYGFNANSNAINIPIVVESGAVLSGQSGGYWSFTQKLFSFDGPSNGLATDLWNNGGEILIKTSSITLTMTDNFYQSGAMSLFDVTSNPNPITVTLDTTGVNYFQFDGGAFEFDNASTKFGTLSYYNLELTDCTVQMHIQGDNINCDVLAPQAGGTTNLIGASLNVLTIDNTADGFNWILVEKNGSSTITNTWKQVSLPQGPPQVTADTSVPNQWACKTPGG